MKLLSSIDQQSQPEHDSSDHLPPSSLVTSVYSVPLTLLTGNTRKCVPLLGGYAIQETRRDHSSLTIPMIPTSYTDLYAELGTILPDCEQTAVCLICGQILNAGGRGECTRHAAKCGAGAGIFFLLQECTGLLLHKNKAAYIQSPYVDSHGETPQYRGRPLNLDMDRYELLRELWFSHGVRQKVVAERVGTRQMIVPDFY
jgi:Proteolysis_6 C-terminal